MNIYPEFPANRLNNPKRQAEPPALMRAGRCSMSAMPAWHTEGPGCRVRHCGLALPRKADGSPRGRNIRPDVSGSGRAPTWSSRA